MTMYGMTKSAEDRIRAGEGQRRTVWPMRSETKPKATAGTSSATSTAIAIGVALLTRLSYRRRRGLRVSILCRRHARVACTAVRSPNRMPRNPSQEAIMVSAPATPTSPTPTPQAAPLSQGARIVNTFIAPSKTFTDLRRSAAWWAPWILISIFSLAFIFAMAKQVGFEQISKNQVAHSSRADQFDKLPADQQAKQLQLSSKIVGFFSYFSPLLILFYFLISTVVLWATFKVGAGAETTFGQAYAI